jgi:hypothetical protein
MRFLLVYCEKIEREPGVSWGVGAQADPARLNEEISAILPRLLKSEGKITENIKDKVKSKKILGKTPRRPIIIFKYLISYE